MFLGLFSNEVSRLRLLSGHALADEFIAASGINNDSKRQFLASYFNRRRIENFEKDYPTFLMTLCSSLRTGLDPLVAVLDSIKMFEPESEIAIELNKFKQMIDNGLSEREAISRFAESINHPDIELFRTAYYLARLQGVSLADALQRLVKVTRQRQSFRRKSRSAVVMQRMSAFGISLSAILICLIQSIGNPQILLDSISHPIGSRLLGLGAGLIIIGMLVMLRITRNKI